MTILVMLEAADLSAGQSVVTIGTGAYRSPVEGARRVRRIARRFNYRSGLQANGISIFRTFLWHVVFIRVQAVDTSSRSGECVIVMRRSPFTWFERRTGALERCVSEAVAAAGYRVDKTLENTITQISKGMTHANHPAAK